MSNLLGTSFAKAGFSWDPNISPNNQSFSAAVRAVDAAGGFVLAPPGPTINGSVITLNGTVTVTGTLNARGNIILGTATAFGWGGTWGGNNPNLPVIQIGNGGIQPRSIDGLQILSGIFHNGTNFIYTGTGTDNSGTSTGILANVTAGAFQIRSDLGTGGTNGAVASLSALFQVAAAGNATIFTPSSGTALTVNGVTGTTALAVIMGGTASSAILVEATFTGATANPNIIGVRVRTTATASTKVWVSVVNSSTSAGAAAGLSLAGGTAVFNSSDLEIYQAGDGGAYIYQGANREINFFTNTVLMFKVGGTTTTPTISGYGPTAAGLVDMTPDTGTFNGTATGMSNPPVFACKWTRVGTSVTLTVNTSGASLLGTSNATSFTMGQLPAAITPPTTTQYIPYAFLVDSGANASGNAVAVQTSGALLFFKGNSASGASWTGSGQKGSTNSCTISYQLI